MKKQIANKKGVTLIELVILILVTAIIGATIAGAVIFFVQLFLYSPRQLDTQKIGQELIYDMVEGIQDKRGMRYARAIIDASATQFSYTYGYPTSDEQLSVRFRWASDDGHIYRSTRTDDGSSWSVETVIPYHISNAITIDSRDPDTPGVIFTYERDNGELSDIRRVIIDITIATGTGSFSDMQGSTDFTSSVEIKDFLQ